MSICRRISCSRRRWWRTAAARRLLASPVVRQELHNGVDCPDHEAGEAEELQTVTQSQPQLTL